MSSKQNLWWNEEEMRQTLTNYQQTKSIWAERALILNLERLAKYIIDAKWSLTTPTFHLYHEDREDWTQEAIITCSKALDRYDPDLGQGNETSLYLYCYCNINNIFRSLYRKSQRPKRKGITISLEEYRQGIEVQDD